MTLRGGQRQLLLLAEGLRARGHQQLIACVEGAGLERRAHQLGLEVFALPAHDPAHAFATMLLRQHLKLWKPQILHAHDGRGQTLAWLASMGLPVVRIASRRVTFLPRDGWTYRWKYGRTCHAVITVSENIRQLSIQAGVPKERIEVIPDGIELPAELPSSAARLNLRSSWGCDEHDFVLGMLGASTPEKGWDVMIAALALLRQRTPGVKLVLAGDGPAEATTFAAANSGSAGILRLGPIENLTNFFPGLDLFVMPSKSEGLGSSALWAMAYGLPVVATGVGGLPEIVAENESGWLVPPGSPQALADAIVAAAADRQKLAEFGGNGRRRAAHFSADIMVARTEALYERLVSGMGDV